MHQRLLQLFSKAVSLKIHLSDVFSQSLALVAARRYRVLSYFGSTEPQAKPSQAKRSAQWAKLKLYSG